jgi:hypothetical protein
MHRKRRRMGLGVVGGTRSFVDPWFYFEVMEMSQN